MLSDRRVTAAVVSFGIQLCFSRENVLGRLPGNYL
jgi:hypothetical protein